MNKSVTIERCVERISLDIVKAIIEKHLTDFTRFAGQVLSTDGFRERS